MNSSLTYKTLRVTLYLNLLSILFADERLYLKQAKTLENKTIKGQSIKFISGDVIFTKGDLILNCEKGRHYEKTELAVLFKNVSAIQEQRILTCDTIKFFQKKIVFLALVALTSGIKITILKLTLSLFSQNKIVEWL